MQNKTIAACSTSMTPTGVGVIRVSGSKAKDVIHNFFKSKNNPIDTPRSLCFGKFQSDNQILDNCMAVFFNAPYSYTGEDTVEFHVHGNPILIKNILNEIFKLGIIPAAPGEFTQLAYLNNKIDLIQAESVAEIINATSTKALKLAQENLEGKLTILLETITEPLTNSLAEIEANIDFTDEDIQPETLEKIFLDVKDTSFKLEKLIKSFNSAQNIKEGIRVLLFGKPNTGKSSLLNKLLNRDRAIVSNIAGTTRDLLEEQIQLGELSFVFIDSAGIRESNDDIENIGVKLAVNSTLNADLILIMCDENTTQDELDELLNKIPQELTFWIIKNKIDLNTSYKFKENGIEISAKTNKGIDILINQLIIFGQSKTSESAYITNARQKSCLESAYNFCLSIDESDSLEILSLKIRAALTAVDEIIGKTHTEDILGRIFSKFCVGK